MLREKIALPNNTMARRIRTLGEAARSTGLDEDEILIRLWEAGLDQYTGLGDRIPRRDLDEVHRALEIPTRNENDVYARYRVRLGEMRQSARIITQALEGMPEGPWQADAPHVVLPERERMKTQMEALIYHFKIVTEGFRVPAGDVYQCIESPRGEIGYYIVSDGTSKPYRVFMRTPSFGNLQALGVMLDGALIADSIAALGSMDFVLGDVDR